MKRYLRISGFSVEVSSFQRRGFGEPFSLVALKVRKGSGVREEALGGVSVGKSRTERSKKQGLVVSEE